MYFVGLAHNSYAQVNTFTSEWLSSGRRRADIQNGDAPLIHPIQAFLNNYDPHTHHTVVNLFVNIQQMHEIKLYINT